MGEFHFVTNCERFCVFRVLLIKLIKSFVTRKKLVLEVLAAVKRLLYSISADRCWDSIELVNTVCLFLNTDVLLNFKIRKVLK